MPVPTSRRPSLRITWPRVAAAAYVAVLGAAVTLSVAAARHERLPGDLPATRKLQDWPQPAGLISEAVRAATSTEVAVIAGLALAAALVVGRRVPFGVASLALFVALPVLQRAIKALVDRPRPPGDLVDIRGSATSASFPSGHVMSGTVMFVALTTVALCLPLPAPFRWGAVAVCAVLTLAGGFANIHEGVHWPSDVLGGYLWAAVLAWPFLWFARVSSARERKATGR